ncbi:fibronectin type III domain-containing protein [Spirosoma sp.]|uniref:fibronectin type III domain-containing protein n=1 Tax=Spirosoma sp. TaxID=1899569 RepID=UPI002616FE92|nr:fibronectin type III domain-containing protein [Spirosoma sp.]MCX6216499.1 fibronectin type III domain-containing protein [Spirosoma sp.]
MKPLLFLLFLFSLAIPLRAQVSEPTAIRIYRISDQITTADAAGNITGFYPYADVSVKAEGALIKVSVKGVGTLYYSPALFWTEQGTPYGSTVNAALNLYLLSIPASSSGGSGGTTAATTNAGALVSGTLDDARLSANVVKTTGSYSNPTWLSALDPSRISQNSLNRFTSDAEKDAWNAKQAPLVSGSNIKTINDIPILGPGNIVIGGGSGGTTTSATSLTAGTLDDARLSANVVKTSSTYSNPGWITAFDPTRITQTSLYRFVSDNEKLAWNNKQDALGFTPFNNADALTVNYTGAGVSVNQVDKTVTVTIPGGTSVVIDQALNSSSVNGIANGVVASALNTLTTGLSTANGNIATNTASIATHTTGIATNTNSITANTASIAAISSAITALNATVVSLQSQVAALTGTFTIAAPALTASNITNTGMTLSWPASTSATSYALEMATNAGYTTGLVSLTTTSALSYAVTGLTLGTQYWFRIKASGGAGTTASAYGTTTATTTSVAEASYTVTRIIRGQNMQSTFAVATTANVNQLKPTASQLTTAGGGYTSQSLITETGTASGVTLSITAPFAQASSSLSTSAVAGSLYPLDMYKGAWMVTSATPAQVSFNNLDPTKKYRLLLYPVSATSTGSTAFVVGGVTKEKAVSNNFGVGGGNELDPNTALVEFKNITPDGNNAILMNVNRGTVTGSGSVPWNTFVLEEYSGTRP